MRAARTTWAIAGSVLLAASTCAGGYAPGIGADAGSAAVELVAQESPGVVRRSWIEANAQARQFGGRLFVTAGAAADAPVTFAFAHGVTVRARKFTDAPGDLPIGARAETYRDLLGLPEGANVTLYRVLEERVAESAPIGGLCGGLRTTALAAAEFVDADGAWSLRLGSLRGADATGGPATWMACFALDYRLSGSSP